MPRMTSSLPRSVGKWVSQVAASVGATLVASMIYSALPRPATAGMPAVPPELTSGGKFAARAVVPVAYDGLDTMPLPHVAPAPVSAILAETAAPAADVRRVAWDGAVSPTAAPLVAAPERAARVSKPSHAVARVEARRTAVATVEPASVVAASEAGSPRAKVEAEAQADGFMPKILPRILPKIMPDILSTAHEAWTMTASAGGSLMARVVPQLP